MHIINIFTGYFKIDTNNIFDMSYVFQRCTSIESLPDISKWNTNNVNYMSGMFSCCSSLSSLSDISNGILLMLLI